MSGVVRLICVVRRLGGSGRSADLGQRCSQAAGGACRVEGHSDAPASPARHQAGFRQVLGRVVAALDPDVGRRRGRAASGVSSSNTTTASTHSRASSSSARSCWLMMGRCAPLSRRTDSSELRQTIRQSPSCARRPASGRGRRAGGRSSRRWPPPCRRCRGRREPAGAVGRGAGACGPSAGRSTDAPGAPMRPRRRPGHAVVQLPVRQGCHATGGQEVGASSRPWLPPREVAAGPGARQGLQPAGRRPRRDR